MAKITNNFILGGVNQDSDNRLIPNGSLKDIKNAITNVSEGDDLGTLENVLGNVKETDINSIIQGTISNPKVIGSRANQSKNVIYFFVAGDNYDLILDYNTKTKQTRRIIQDNKNNILNFDKNKRITHINVINKSSDFGDAERDSDLLSFCGDDNSPKILNVERARSYGFLDVPEDDITVIKPPPRKAPDITPLRLIDEGDGLEDEFLIFAYRYRYKDGYYSAISSSSEYLFSPSAFNINFDTFENEGMSNIYNACDIEYSIGSKTVTDVQLLYKRSNSQNWFIIEDIDVSEESSEFSTKTFRFKNNKNYRVLPEAEYFRSFDNVPLSAKTQEYIGGRLMYGNFLEQRDLVDETGEDISFNFEASFVSEGFNDLTIPVESDGGNVIFKLGELPDNAIEEGVRLDINFNIRENQFGNDFQFLLSVFLDLNESSSNNYNSAIVNAPEFIEAISGLESFFAENGFPTPQGSTFISSTGFFRFLQGEDLAIGLPVVSFETSNGGVIRYIYEDIGTVANIRSQDSASSMKSGRNYEICKIFLDKEGRKTTAITSPDNTVNIPYSFSDRKNTLQVTIPEDEKPPVWADRYKFGVKKVGLWDTFYSNRFYVDGAFRWVKLEGDDINKVSVGDDVIVKRDSNGILNEERTVKILDIVNQDRDFIPNNTVEGSTQEIIEESGNYIKLRPSGFSLDYSENEFINIVRESNVSSERPYLIVTNEDTNKPLNPFRKTIDSDDDLPFSQGTIFDIKEFLSRRDGSGGDSSLVKKAFVANSNYSDIFDFITALNNYIPPNLPNTSLPSGATEPTGYFETQDEDGKFISYWVVRGEIVPTNDTGGTYLIGDDGRLVQDFGARTRLGGFLPGVKVRLDETGTKPYVFVLKGSEAGRSNAFGTRRGKADLVLNIRVVDGYYVFETKPKDLDDNIFYETPETYDIVDGDYVQREHILSRYFNCFTQGNGAESIRFKDKFNANFLNVDFTPTTTTEDRYSQSNRFADITYSGIFNDNSGVNALNEFNLSTANFKDDIDKNYGGIYRMYNKDTNLILFQEDKVSIVGVGESELFNADGSTNITRIANVLGNQRAYSGEYGISRDTDSFAVYGNYMYFTDRKRGVFCRLGNNGVFEISSRGLKSYARNLFRENDVTEIIGCYDDYVDAYVLNLKYVKNNLGFKSLAPTYDTWFWKDSINQSGGGWISNQEFNPEDMVALNGNLFSFNQGELYRHNTRDLGIYNTFYGNEVESSWSISMNAEPNNRKNFKTIELDGSDTWDITTETNIKENGTQKLLSGEVNSENFVKEESIYRAYIRGENSDTFIQSDSLNVNGIGVAIDTLTANSILFENNVNEEISDGDLLATEEFIFGRVLSVNGKRISYELLNPIITSTDNGLDPNSFNLVNGSFIFSFKNPNVETSGLVGNFMIVKGTLSKTTKTELFSVSSEVFISSPKT